MPILQPMDYMSYGCVSSKCEMLKQTDLPLTLGIIFI